MGIIFILITVLSWGTGDFLTQKNARKFGGWNALFFTSLTGTIFLLPFIVNDLDKLARLGTTPEKFLSFIALGVAYLIASGLLAAALTRGKLSVIDPISTLDLLVTALLALVVANELLSSGQYLLIGLLLLGIFLISMRTLDVFKSFSVEKGVFLAALATIGFGIANFLFAINSRTSNPVFINWFTSIVILVVSTYKIRKNFRKKVEADFKLNGKNIFFMSLFNNVSWIAFSYSTLYVPIAIATGLTEAYVVVGSLLGIFFNKEKLKRHQWLGLGVTIVAGVLLAATTEF